MTSTILAILLLGLALAGIVVRKTYYYVPARELKRRAEKHDPVAGQLYRAVAYGNSLRSLLWLYVGLTSAASLVLLARQLPIWVSLLIVGPLLWIAFSLIPATRMTRLGERLTMIVTPLIAWLLNYFHPLLNRGADVIERRYVAKDRTKLYEREDLLELIERQQWQTDSRLSDEELEIIKRAIRFGEHHVVDILVPRKQVKTVLASDTLGPVLINELHQTGQDYVLVQDKKKGKYVGTLAIKTLGIQTTGKVQDVMAPTVYYLHEQDSLSDALHAFFVTNRPVFVVLNSFEEHVGIITMENILHQLLGHIPGDDFDEFASATAVAARHARRDKSQPAKETPVKTDDEVVE
jgi:CBS domain containing-hemolysin-like protein